MTTEQLNFDFVTSPQPDVMAALMERNRINKLEDVRASFWAVQFDDYRLVTVEVFSKDSVNYIQTISFTLRPDGSVNVTRNTHS